MSSVFFFFHVSLEKSYGGVLNIGKSLRVPVEVLVHLESLSGRMYLSCPEGEFPPISSLLSVFFLCFRSSSHQMVGVFSSDANSECDGESDCGRTEQKRRSHLVESVAQICPKNFSEAVGTGIGFPVAIALLSPAVWKEKSAQKSSIQSGTWRISVEIHGCLFLLLL